MLPKTKKQRRCKTCGIPIKPWSTYCIAHGRRKAARVILKFNRKRGYRPDKGSGYASFFLEYNK